MPQTKLFQPIDAMDIRKQLGLLLNKVALTHQRFIIQRRGAPMAMLVPLEDQQAITRTLGSEKAELEGMYKAIESLNGVIDDPNGSDASETIDEWLYGQESDAR
jgi:prevent-host-death family protein